MRKSSGARTTKVTKPKSNLKPKKGGRRTERKMEHSDSTASFDHEDMQPVEKKIIPEDQVDDLTTEQLNEVFTKVITATNPNHAKGVTRFNYKEGAYIADTTLDHLAVHFSMDSILIHKDSKEARAYEEQDEEPVAAAASAAVPPATGEGEAKQTTSSGTSTDDREEAGEARGPNGRVLKNQFNFSERASQTFNNPMRDRGVATEPPPTTDCGGNVTQWEIFDSYLAEFQKQRDAKNPKDKNKTYGKEEKEDGPVIAMQDTGTVETQVLKSEKLLNAVKIMERMVNQNFQEDTFLDFKFYEDEADAIREDGKGDFLPLWRFKSHHSKKQTVTSLCWNPKFTDLFAVGYGSYDFMKQGKGNICCFSLKNTEYPEYVIETTAGVMSLDFHPQHSSLLAVGLYDGTVCVYDVRKKGGEPIYESSNPKVKHTDPVWQVHWQPIDSSNKDINFFSVSSDGRVTNWILNKNELVNEEVMELKMFNTDKKGDVDEDGVVGLAGGSCFDFNKKSQHLFVVGTEEGSITTYSKAYNSRALESYDGHHMSVYGLKWNPFHPRVFLSCSADWTVKLWDYTRKSPIMTFDLANAVGDIAWAPYSSTVFATITSDGKLRLYDLSVNKHEAIGETRVVKKAKLTHVCFNPKEPIVLVGDDSGAVMSLKLSPNLRKMSAPKVDQIVEKEEVSRLDQLLVVSED